MTPRYRKKHQYIAMWNTISCTRLDLKFVLFYQQTQVYRDSLAYRFKETLSPLCLSSVKQ